MKLPILCFIFGGLEGLIRGETFLEANEYNKYAVEITRELADIQPKQQWAMTDQRGIDNGKFGTQTQNDGQARGFPSGELKGRGIYTKMNTYLMRSLQTSVNSLFNLDKFYQAINPDEEEDLPQTQNLRKTAELRGPHNHYKKHVHTELTYFTVLLILKFVGVLVTKVKFAIGIMMIKLFVGKLILLYLYTKHHKHHHPGPLVKAYHTTTNEFHNHRRHHDHKISPPYYIEKDQTGPPFPPPPHYMERDRTGPPFPPPPYYIE